jgi:tetratricopeptide (TPR) repeat protein
MIRTMTVSAILGALVAGVAAYTVSPSLWQTAMGLRSGGSEQTADAKPAFEEWPICTMTVAMPDADWAKLDPEFAAGKKALVAEDWDGAIAVLKSAALRDPRNADIQNYIGYAYRRLRQMGPAIGHYQQALMLNARHRSATSISAKPTWCLAIRPRPSSTSRIWKTSASSAARSTTTSSGRSRGIRGWWLAEECSAGGRIKAPVATSTSVAVQKSASILRLVRNVDF